MVAGSIRACSLLYNPSNLPTAPIDAEIVPDAMIDAEVVADADPSMIAITSVSPGIVNEGQGDGGSHPAMIVVEGMQFVPGAKITLTKHSDQSPFAGAVVDDANTIVSDDGYEIAAPVKFKVDTTLPAGMMVRLDVTVTQKTASGMTVTKTLTAGPGNTPVLQENGLGELHDGQAPLLANNVLPDNVYTFSEVLITTNSGGKSIVPKDNTAPMIIRAIASVKITGAISLDAAGQIAGPGGNNGGAGGMAGLSPTPGGPGGGRTGGGTPHGGGGSFGTKGGNGGGQAGGTSGERWLLTLSVLQGLDSSSGGAGAGARRSRPVASAAVAAARSRSPRGGDLTLNGAISSIGGDRHLRRQRQRRRRFGRRDPLARGRRTRGRQRDGDASGPAGAGGRYCRWRGRPRADPRRCTGSLGARLPGTAVRRARRSAASIDARRARSQADARRQGTERSAAFGYFFENADGTMSSATCMTATIANRPGSRHVHDRQRRSTTASITSA